MWRSPITMGERSRLRPPLLSHSSKSGQFICYKTGQIYLLLTVGIVDERVKRLLVAAEAECLGYGGISVVSRETGVSRRAIAEGIKELK
jgi:hypothetical protein